MSRATMLVAGRQLFRSDPSGYLRVRHPATRLLPLPAAVIPRFWLTSIDRPVFHIDCRGQGTDALSATITVGDARADFDQATQIEPGAARIFIVRDPDGNLIPFGGG